MHYGETGDVFYGQPDDRIYQADLGKGETESKVQAITLLAPDAQWQVAHQPASAPALSPCHDR